MSMNERAYVKACGKVAELKKMIGKCAFDHERLEFWTSRKVGLADKLGL